MLWEISLHFKVNAKSGLCEENGRKGKGTRGGAHCKDETKRNIKKDITEDFEKGRMGRGKLNHTIHLYILYSDLSGTQCTVREMEHFVSAGVSGESKD